ncbi:MAG: ACP S-malonyltransferase [Oligoflexia bacterium]|nr:ACP S-malonyltransferase [Oligoflexia bacterium]
MKTALLFPGQGSQYVGMGFKWIEAFPYAKSFFDRADNALGFSISDVCFNGPDEKLAATEFTQPAILTTSMAMFEILKRESGLAFDYVAGHSLGEYSALVAAGALDFEQAVRIVNIRGRLMQRAVPAGKGKMAAVRKCDPGMLNKEIAEVVESTGLVLAAANYNSDDQIVVSGSSEAVDMLLSNLKEKKVKSIPLNVSAPFHSPLMSGITDEFKRELDRLDISTPSVPYLANIDAEIHDEAGPIVSNFSRQISGSVLWTQIIKNLAGLGVNRAVEVGPGKVLSGLCARIENSFECLSLDNVEDIRRL